ncbi:hypothetical protein WMY93_013047 [Mugilogobius chulae]|uniref:ZP domain-containing protein n=1 Tax=Mugilogobius chulae TaxID=88201 RepID=A0AAW0P5B2_9GOBI
MTLDNYISHHSQEGHQTCTSESYMSLCWVPAEMYILTLVILLQGLAWPASCSPPLGMTVHVVPYDSSKGQTVRAHFTAIVPGECTAVTGLCGSCEVPHHFHVSVRDLDGDRVHCRFAKEDQGECVNCEPHSFIELDSEKCSFSFTGDAAVGVHYIYMMAEDVVPAPQSIKPAQSTPLSAVPFILALTVEEAKYSCSAEPVASSDNPVENSVHYILPFHQKSFTVNYDSNEESVTEIAVIGPPQLYRSGFLSLGPVATLNIAWVRSENKLARLIPVCFSANTPNLQSEPSCVWLYQREMMALPTGTVLTSEQPSCPITHNDTHLTARIALEGCGTKAVHSGDELIYTNTLQTVRTYTKVIRRQPILVLPLACRIPSIQAKGPNYKVGIPKEKEVFGEVEFKLEFHFPGKGPLGKFTTNPTFRYDNRRIRRELRYYCHNAKPSNITALINNTTSITTVTTASTTTVSTTTASLIGSKIDTLDLYVTSNCSVERAEILVSSCMESETEDFAISSPLLEQGCTASSGALEVVTTATGTKIYRLDLSGLKSEGTTMYVKCTVNLCITTQPSAKCPDLCTTKLTRSSMVNNVFSSSYTITSPAVSLVYTTAPPTTLSTTPQTTVTTTTTKPTTTAATSATAATTAATTTKAPTTTSHAPEKASSMTVGAMVALLCVILQYFL